MKVNAVIIICFAVLVCCPATADIIHVPSDQHTIQAGIDAAADGDTVLVADGTYYGTGNRNIDFLGKAITVRSENGPENCLIDNWESYGYRIFHFHSGEGRDSVLEGFGIEGGYVSGAGGGILCEGASPTIQGNIIRGNITERTGSYTDGGGGIACFEASPLITGNTIDQNVSAVNGGGIYCGPGCSAIITDNLIEENFVDDWYYGGNGGGIGAEGSSVVIRNNTLRDNNGDWYGGGICCYYDCEVDISDNLITGNICQIEGAIFLANCTGTCSGNDVIGNPGNGAGIACYESSLTLDNNTVSDNSGGISFNSWSWDPITVPVTDTRQADAHRGALSIEVTNNTISENGGPGISVSNAVNIPVIRGNLISGNSTSQSGSGIRCTNDAGMTLQDNVIEENTTSNQGGGIFISTTGPVTISSCSIKDNEAEDKGGGIYLACTNPITITNVLITGNVSGYLGGGILVFNETSLQLESCTITGNSGTHGSGILSWGTVDIANSIIWGNSTQELQGEFTVHHSDIGGGWTGTGNLDTDPIFVSGPLGGYYLSQTAAGQAADSPCVDAGDPGSVVPNGTTRTDHVQDTGVVDMGYHSPLNTPTSLVTGPGSGPDNPPLVRVCPPWQDADHTHEFVAYGALGFGVNVSAGDVTGSGADTILTGAGPGEIYGPHVRGYQIDGTPLPGLSFLAYGTNKYGVNVASGDLDADGYDEIITGAGPGAVFGPHVRGWDYDGSGAVSALGGVNYFAYGTPKWGVNVAAGDIDGDGFDEIITGPGPGAVYGPHVRGWNVDGGAAVAMPGVSFFAYGTNQYGVNVTCGDVDGDGIDEIVTGPGPGAVFGAHIRGWNFDGQALTDIDGINFFAWAHALASYGANVFAGTDLDQDGRDEIVVGCGPDPDVSTPVKVYLYDGVQVTQWFSLEAFEGMTHGTTVAAGRF